MSKNKTDRLLKLKNVIEIAGIGKSTIYSLLQKNKFPKPVRLSPRAIRFSENAIQDWIEEKKQK